MMQWQNRNEYAREKEDPIYFNMQIVKTGVLFLRCKMNGQSDLFVFGVA